MEQLTETIKVILEEHPEARNSDKFLIIEVLRALGFKIYIDYKEINDMPSFESITRIRRLLQEKNPNLLSDEPIKDFRDKKREEMLSFLREQKNDMRVSVNTVVNSRTRGVEIFSR
jgi:ABC-type thiamine transport system ATPase subunit